MRNGRLVSPLGDGRQVVQIFQQLCLFLCKDIVTKTRASFEALAGQFAQRIGQAEVADANEAAKELQKGDRAFIDPPYSGVHYSRFYYQDAAIRAVLENVARGQNRALLSLATGAGKTFIASHLLKRIADAGQLKRALFVCDRDELRTQAVNALNNVFGSDAAEVFEDAEGRNNAPQRPRPHRHLPDPRCGFRGSPGVVPSEALP